MGRIYTWSEVSEGHVPSAEQIQKVADTLIDELGGLTEGRAKLAQAAVLFGSNAWRRPSSRSDVDALVVTTGSRAESIDTLRDIVDHSLSEPTNGSVKVELSVCSAAELEVGTHDLPPTFMRQIVLGRQITHGTPLKELINIDYPPEQIFGDTNRYVRLKLGRMTKYALSPDLDYRAHQRLLELPQAIARRVCDIGELTGLSAKNDGSDKQPTYDQAMTLLEELHPSVTENMTRLRNADTEYTGLLENSIDDPQEHKQAYDLFLKNSRQEARVALEWLPVIGRWVEDLSNNIQVRK